MIDLAPFKDRRIAVLGLGRTGVAAARALRAAGAEVIAWDDKPETRASSGLATRDPSAEGWRGIDLLVLSPGIPHSFPAPNPHVAAARAAGVAIVGDVELLIRARPAGRLVGITGTNGKSTTTALIGHILTEAGVPAAVGGNLGAGALGLDPVGPGGAFVLELSSYQLELIDSGGFDVGVLLNITPDHLDRHGGMDGYVAAKERLFRNRGPNQTAVVGIDDPICRAIADRLPAPVARISAEGPAAGGVYAAEGGLVDDLDGRAQHVLTLADAPALPGVHNAQNIAAAYAAARALGLAPEVITAAIRSFPGLRHRMSRIATIDGVLFVNDSKATNADAAARALACYDAVHWIAGGVPKAGGITPLAPFFPRIRHAYLIGEAAEAFAETLGAAVPHTRAGTLAHAVDLAFAGARGTAGAVVLLSPACASFDQFSDFEARGAAFEAEVARLQRSAA